MPNHPDTLPLIFDLSSPGRVNSHLWPGLEAGDDGASELPQELLRLNAPTLPEVSEADVVRHYTLLSRRNLGIDTSFYPLGSCTMKHNPRAAEVVAAQPGFARRHPAAPDEAGQGVLACLGELAEHLCLLTGMAEISLSPAAGAQGEFAGVAMMRAWHAARGEGEVRSEIVIPDAAHGTNPATAAMCGMTTRTIPTDADGNMDLEALDRALGPATAGLMLTQPSTLGIFDAHLGEILRRVHAVGGIGYYDGANLNAVLGRARPGDMDFDIVHLNLHKTFATPHGGGGPGAGPVGASAALAPFLPLPLVARRQDGWCLLGAAERPLSIGRLSAWSGNVGVLLRAWAWLRLTGGRDLRRVSDVAVLNAAWLKQRLMQMGLDVAYAGRRCGHEFIVRLEALRRETGITALDIAKALLDRGFHPPTVYFPLLVPECLLIEPTETETRATLDAFAEALGDIVSQARNDPAGLRLAPAHTPVGRLDEARAARQPDLRYRAGGCSADM